MMEGANMKLPLDFKGLVISLWALICPQWRRVYKNIPEYSVPLIPATRAGNRKEKTNKRFEENARTGQQGSTQEK